MVGCRPSLTFCARRPLKHPEDGAGANDRDDATSTLPPRSARSGEPSGAHPAREDEDVCLRVLAFLEEEGVIAAGSAFVQPCDSEQTVRTAPRQNPSDK